jgi:hypothetical protein
MREFRTKTAILAVELYLHIGLGDLVEVARDHHLPESARASSRSTVSDAEPSGIKD